MAPAKIRAITAPCGPPTIWPIHTTRAVNSAKRIVVRKPFIPLLLCAISYETPGLSQGIFLGDQSAHDQAERQGLEFKTKQNCLTIPLVNGGALYANWRSISAD